MILSFRGSEATVGIHNFLPKKTDGKARVRTDSAMIFSAHYKIGIRRAFQFIMNK